MLPATHITGVSAASLLAPAAEQIALVAPSGQLKVWADLIQETRPALFAEPSIQFPLVARQRQQSALDAQSQYQVLLSRQLPADWQRCARGELWLLEGRGVSPKKMAQCPQAASRPRLDGRLDDAIWQRGCRLALESPVKDDQSWPAEVILAHDKQFLFVAARCQKRRDVDYRPSDQPRQRDGQLETRDRVDLLLDIDRDYVTYFQLSVDYQGWARDTCYGDENWNPSWYIAANNANDVWVVEMAIPWEEITPHPPTRNTVWGVGVQRVVPGVGFQSWTEPAAVRIIPEAFGYVKFE
jgi:hypothetical protein